jgi:hypothetical protein
MWFVRILFPMDLVLDVGNTKCMGWSKKMTEFRDHCVVGVANSIHMSHLVLQNLNTYPLNM